MKNEETRRAPTRDEIRLNEACAILGLKTSVDFRDGFVQVSAEFPNDAALSAFAERCGGSEIASFLKRHRQQVALLALRALCDDLGRKAEADEIERRYALDRASLKDGRIALGGFRRGLSDRESEKLRAHLEKAVRHLMPCLKVEYAEGKIRIYLISLALPEPLASLPFGADITDRNSLEHGLRSAMLDMAPGYFS